jgi:hypothetical protein
VNLSVTEMSARDVLAQLRRSQGPGLHIQVNAIGTAWDHKITAKLEGVALGAALQLVEDCVIGTRIVVREYGLLIVPEEKVPPGAVLLGEFWKGGVKADTGTSAGPPRGVEGLVKKVEGKLLTISVGSDAGLARGHTLEVFRLGEKPRYLGRVRVMEVTATAAVCQVVGKMADRVAVGDQVSSRVVPR